MATKPQYTSTAVAADPTLATAAGTSRVPIANLEATLATGLTSNKREALEAVQKAIMAGRISIRRTADGGGRVKPTLTEVQTALAAVLS